MLKTPTHAWQSTARGRPHNSGTLDDCISSSSRLLLRQGAADDVISEALWDIRVHHANEMRQLSLEQHNAAMTQCYRNLDS